MVDLSAQVAYLRGLAEGLAISEDSNEGRVLAGIINVLGDMAEAVETLWASHDELAGDFEELLGESETDEAENEILFIPDPQAETAEAADLS